MIQGRRPTHLLPSLAAEPALATEGPAPQPALASKQVLLSQPTAASKDVEHSARQALSASPVYALRELEVEQRGEKLLIRGSVASFYHKQLAQEAVRQVAEGVEVVNSIHVR